MRRARAPNLASITESMICGENRKENGGLRRARRNEDESDAVRCEGVARDVRHGTTRHHKIKNRRSTQHSTAQHSTAQHSTAHSTTQHLTLPNTSRRNTTQHNATHRSSNTLKTCWRRVEVRSSMSGLKVAPSAPPPKILHTALKLSW
eukprot:2189760-Rhodomonas_salina.1